MTSERAINLMAVARAKRLPDPLDFNEQVRNLIDFAQADGANGCPPGMSKQTKEAAKWLRVAYRDALDAASKEE